ncbi:PREDICTED: uncharacterized protein LOC109215103 [Nicotiana attenuata]|uniref:uncharacterized protein LOC109215103 n=1 Tax=Nicotiana attenuata TaxID=49451 RepID=UPI00090473BD|nr:PREDICTED: uncharacterized protein LOC109215103 [Nicotiana attenuata]
MDTQPYEIENTSMEVVCKNLRQIILSEDDKQRMYNPWKYSLIIKLMGKRIVHHYLKRKTQELWKIDENYPLIDLGEDYYTVKLMKEESMTRILHNGPWFINGCFISVQKWVPNFVANRASQNYTAVWIRLPQFPTEFYDGIILTKIGNYIGKLLKVDACTSATLRGRYARLCVELPLDQPVQTSIMIGHHNQPILYEGEGFLCKNCGRLGHSTHSCPYRIFPSGQPNGSTTNEASVSKEDTAQEWKTVSFPRKSKGKAANQHLMKAISTTDTGTSARFLDTRPGRFLNSQGMNYTNTQAQLNSTSTYTGSQ